jgi:hypothetical protein
LVIGQLDQIELLEQGCLQLLAASDIEVQDVSNRRLAVRDGRAELTFQVRARQHILGGKVLGAIAGLPGVVEVQWS